MAIALARALKNRVPRVDMKREPVINPAIARPLLGLHRASNVDSFSKAVQQLLSAAIPNRLIRLTLQHNRSCPRSSGRRGSYPKTFSRPNRLTVTSPEEGTKTSF